MGFLLRDGKRMIPVDQEVIKQEMKFLEEFAVIACFVEEKPPNFEMQS